jgi:hypothetical protein
MKNLYTRNEFLGINNISILNEGLIKGLFNMAGKLANRIRGSKEITKIYNNNIKLVDDAFAKMTNIETVKGANTINTAGTTNKQQNTNQQNANQKQNTDQQQNANQQNANQQQNDSYSFNENKLNEADVADATANTEPANQEQKNMVNLKPDQIKKIAETTTNRITEIKNQFQKEVEGVIAKLSKNANYSSDRLKQFALITTNEFNSYIYTKWYDFYQKVGDQNKIVELTKLKKQNEANLKKSIDDLNTSLSEQNKQLNIAKGKVFTYFSKSNNADIKVEVIGAALGQDENGQPNTEKPEYKNMWKVKTNKGTFWVSPSSFKKEVVKGEKKPTAKPENTETTNTEQSNTETTNTAQPDKQSAAAQTK